MSLVHNPKGKSSGTVKPGGGIRGPVVGLVLLLVGLDGGDRILRANGQTYSIIWDAVWEESEMGFWKGDGCIMTNAVAPQEDRRWSELGAPLYLHSHFHLHLHLYFHYVALLRGGNIQLITICLSAHLQSATSRDTRDGNVLQRRQTEHELSPAPNRQEPHHFSILTFLSSKQSRL